MIATGELLSTAREVQVTAAFEALGRDRVARGLAANGHSWDDCFLTVARWGDPRPLARAIRSRWGTDAMPFLSNLLGLTPHTINTVVRLWDRHEHEFRSLASAWLEQRSDALPCARASGLWQDTLR